MKTTKHLKIIIASTSLLAASILLAEMARPPMKGADFDKKLLRDTTETHPSGGPSGGYADVVQRILPSVVSIGTYSKKAGRGFGFDFDNDDLEHLPPMFRDFFGDWLGRREPNAPREKRRPAPSKPVQTGLGSGVILTSDGYILTNNHVVDNADELKVGIPGRGRDYTAKVVGTDPQTDVALIKIDVDDLTPATIGDSSKMRVGDVVLAIGSPMGLEQSVTHGIISGLGRSELGIIGKPQQGQAGYENFIQTDAAINPGNSGGPLLDERGRVVGLNAAIETRSGMFAGIGLAIPINMAISVARDLLEGGKVQRGFLGIEMDSLDSHMADYLGVEHGSGVLVNSIVPDSPAAKAGFHEGDAIIAVNDQKVTGPAQLRLIVSANHPGTEVKFRVVRYNDQLKHAEQMDLTATLRPLPEKVGAKTENKTSEEDASKSGDTFIKGVAIENLTEDLRQEYQVSSEVQGVIVTAVEKNSAAYEALEEGDLIVQINHKQVKNVAEAMAARGAPGEIMRLKILRNGRTKFVIVKV
jgi:serine protease Do